MDPAVMSGHDHSMEAIKNDFWFEDYAPSPNYPSFAYLLGTEFYHPGLSPRWSFREQNWDSMAFYWVQAICMNGEKEL